MTFGGQRWAGRVGGSLVAAALVAAAAGVGATATSAQPPVAALRHACPLAPKLVGLSLRQARVRAARHGCRIELESVQPPGPRPGQLVVSQGTPPGQPSSYPAVKPDSAPIKVWLAAICPKPAPTAPPAIEPALTAGPTELISGIFLSGGPPPVPWLCHPPIGPSAGTIDIVDPATGATVASETVVKGQLAVIPLAPGTYTIDGIDTNASVTVDGVTSPIATIPQTVVIPVGMTVRQDVWISVP